jgi:hypothetical protein
LICSVTGNLGSDKRTGFQGFELSTLTNAALWQKEGGEGKGGETPRLRQRIERLPRSHTKTFCAWNLSLPPHVATGPPEHRRSISVKKVSKPRREKKIVVLEEKNLAVAKGSSGYMVSWGLDGEENGGSGEGGNP